MPTVEELELKFGAEFFPYQKDYLTKGLQFHHTCLYFRTGAGKSLSALAMLALRGFDEALVIAPPIGHEAWTNVAHRLGITITTISHAKFRQKTFKLNRKVPIIADEFHMFGGARGAGWTKLERAARGMIAPMILCSATPNYNDSERCYCVEKILDPIANKGGYLEYVYKHCSTEQNPFGIEPIVLGFRDYVSASARLMAVPGVFYVEDNATYVIKDYHMAAYTDSNLQEYSYNYRKHQMESSIIGKKWSQLFYAYLTGEGSLRHGVVIALEELTDEMPDGKVLIYCDSSTICSALEQRLLSYDAKYVSITGDCSVTEKATRLRQFLENPSIQYLIGTAALATGTDGIDKVCQNMIILQDTQDDSLRRQLIGRILPRGAADSTQPPVIHRVIMEY